MEKEIKHDCSTCKHFAQHYMLDDYIGITCTGCWHCKEGVKAKRFRKNCEKYEHGENDYNIHVRNFPLKMLKLIERSVNSVQKNINEVKALIKAKSKK